MLAVGLDGYALDPEEISEMHSMQAI